jgi:hypothetical protein
MGRGRPSQSISTLVAERKRKEKAQAKRARRIARRRAAYRIIDSPSS